MELYVYLAFAIPVNPKIMVGIQKGPDQKYADEYARVNTRINALSTALAAEIQERGFRAKPLAALERTDTMNTKGDFPHN